MGEGVGPVGIEKLGQISVNVGDVPRAVGFYRDVLELPVVLESAGMAFLDCGGTRLMLSVPTSREFDHPSSVLYFTVTDIHAAHAALLARGVNVRRPPHCIAQLGDRELWMAFFLDSEGNTLALMSELPVRV